MYKRVIIKMSGEALKGDGSFGIDPKKVKQVANEIKEIHDLGVQIGIVVGAGNLWRGKLGKEIGMDQAQADYMGMLGTVMNALALQDALESLKCETRVMNALRIDEVSEPYLRRKAISHLEKNRIIIFAGGTGSPFFTTDSCATLRAAELNADIILMAKNGVDGVYNKDPKTNKDAKKYKKITHREILDKRLKVIDQTAAAMCYDNHINIHVFDMNKKGNFKKAVLEKQIGTLVVWQDNK